MIQQTIVEVLAAELRPPEGIRLKTGTNAYGVPSVFGVYARTTSVLCFYADVYTDRIEASFVSANDIRHIPLADPNMHVLSEVQEVLNLVKSRM